MKPVTITVNDDGKEKIYTLEFNKRVLRAASEAGFSPDQVIADKQLIKIYDWFWLAFQMHHAGTTRQTTDAIIDSWGGIAQFPEGLVEKLFELWNAAYEVPEESKPKNLIATVDF